MTQKTLEELQADLEAKAEALVDWCNKSSEVPYVQDEVVAVEAALERLYRLRKERAEAERPPESAAQPDVADIIAGGLLVSRGTAYELMREALKEVQPVPVQPVAWLVVGEYIGGKRLDIQWNIDADVMACALGRLPLYATPPAQPAPVQEPVAWTVIGKVTDWSKDFHPYRTQIHQRPVYTTPPAAQPAVPLTPAEVHGMAEAHGIDGDARHWYVVGITDSEKHHKITKGQP